MRRFLPIILIFLVGCASNRHEKNVEIGNHATVEHETHGHHSHQAANDCASDNIGQDILDDVESSLIGAFFQAIFDSIFHRDD